MNNWSSYLQLPALAFVFQSLYYHFANQCFNPLMCFISNGRQFLFLCPKEHRYFHFLYHACCEILSHYHACYWSENVYHLHIYSNIENLEQYKSWQHSDQYVTTKPLKMYLFLIIDFTHLIFHIYLHSAS